MIDVYVYENGLTCDVEFDSSLYGYSYKSDKGLVLEHSGDAFIFSKKNVVDFSYKSSIDCDGQASGLLFGLSENNYSYYVVTVDFKDNLVKLWQSGIGDLKVVSYQFSDHFCNLEVTVEDGQVTVKLNDEATAIMVYSLEDYSGGRLGLNVYNSKTTFNDIKVEELKDLIFDGSEDVVLGSYSNVIKVVNATDFSYRLTENNYAIVDGEVIISKEYLNTLKSNDEYVFRVVTSGGFYDKKITTNFTGSTLKTEQERYLNTETITLTLEGAQNVLCVKLNGNVITDYTVSNNLITLGEELVSTLLNGNHSIEVYTENGRPELSFRIYETYDYEEVVEEANHIFFYIDIAIFATFILGYVVFTIIKKSGVK